MAAVTGQAVSERGATPLAAADDDAFVALVSEAQASLAQGVEKAGLGRDPYRFMMAALAEALGVLPAFVRRLDGTVEHARHPMDAEMRDKIVAVYERQARLERQDRLALARTGAWKGWRRRVLISAGIVLVLLGEGAGLFAAGWSHGAVARVAELCQGSAVREQDGGQTCAFWLFPPLRKGTAGR
jgi:hypothetical protein